MINVTINGCKISLNDKTGGIVRLTTVGGKVVLDSVYEEASLIDVAYPLEKFGPLRLETPQSTARIETDNCTYINIYYDSLAPSRNDVGYVGTVVASVKITADEDGKSLIFKAKLLNKTDKTVPQVLFPDFRGILPENTYFRRGGVKMRPFTELGANYMGGVNQYFRGCWWEHFPPSGGFWGGTSLGRWSDFGSLESGISVYDKGWFPDKEHSVYLRVPEKTPVRARMCFTKEIPSWNQLDGNIQLLDDEGIKPNSSYETSEFIVTVHDGGWPKGIENYRAWVDKKNKPLPIPKHVKEEIGFKTVYMAELQEYDEKHCEFLWKDIPDVAKECKEAGISEINCWGAWKSFFTLPLELDPKLGTNQDFKNAMDKLSTMGVNMNILISVTTLMPDSSKKFGGKGTQNEGWSYHSEAIPAINPGYYKSFAGEVVDTSNEEWQDCVLENINNLIEQGVMSFTWDQYFTREGKRTLNYVAENILKQSSKKNHMATFSSESTGTLETESPVMHYTWNWRGDTLILFKTSHRMADYAAPALSVWKSPRLNLNVECDEKRIIKGFVDNFYLNFLFRKPDHIWGSGRFSDYPNTFVLVKKLSELKNRFLNYFTKGILLGDGAMNREWNNLHNSCYLYQNSLLFFIFNDGIEKVANVEIGIDLDMWIVGVSENAHVIRYNIDGQVIEKLKQNSSKFYYNIKQMDKNELAIFEIKAEGCH